MRRSLKKSLPAAAILATLGLFAVMITLQSHWIEQLSEADLQRSRLGLQESLRVIKTDVNREITAAYSLFAYPAFCAPESRERAAALAFSYWRQKSRFPEFMQRLLLVEPARGNGELHIAAYDENTRHFEPIAWPAELTDMQHLLFIPFRGFAGFGVPTFTGVAISNSAPVLVAPITPSRPRRFSDATGWVVAELDQDFLVTKMLPRIMRNRMQRAAEFDFQISLSGAPEIVLYKSDPKVTFGKPDSGISLLEVGEDYFQHGIGGSEITEQSFVREPIALPGRAPNSSREHGVWQFQVQHRLGSLAAAAGRLRRSNLMLSSAMIALVILDLVMLALLMRRVHRFGAMKLEFAAVVSHELRTPLAAICSAADNLAAGVAHEPSKVQQYGAAILKQGNQLSEMVEQILAFASEQLGKKQYESEMLNPGAAVKQAIAAVSTSAHHRGMEIEQQIPPDLPEIVGDPAAIRQAVVNLLTNAQKYAADGRWIGVTVSNSKAGEIEISVEDRGPGIRSAELKRIFEPFYRGFAAANSTSHGSGLGLTIVDQIVRAHGGKVTVASTLGRGTRFTLHLPTI